MPENKSESTTAPEPVPRADSVSTMMEKLRLGYYSDFVIKCGDDEYKVHKAIISSKSDFFEKACFGSFKEASQAIVELKEDNPDAVKAMVEYFYFDKYLHIECASFANLPWGTKDSMNLEWVPLHARIYILGDKYDIPGLREVAQTNLKDALRKHPQWAETAQFRQAVQTVYEETVKSATIRQVIVNVIVRNKACVLDDELRDLIFDYPELSEEVIVMFGSHPSGVATDFRAHCTLCGRMLTGAETFDLVVHGDFSLHSLTPNGWRWGISRSCDGGFDHCWILKRVSVSAPAFQVDDGSPDNDTRSTADHSASWGNPVTGDWGEMQAFRGRDGLTTRW